MEEIPEPEGVFRSEPGRPRAPRRLPGFTFQAWLAVISALTCLQFLRWSAEQARAAGVPRAGAALDALAAVGAVGFAAAALVVVSRKLF